MFVRGISPFGVLVNIQQGLGDCVKRVSRRAYELVDGIKAAGISVRYCVVFQLLPRPFGLGFLGCVGGLDGGKFAGPSGLRPGA